MINSTQFAKLKQEALNKQPLRKQVQLGDIKFVTSDTIYYSGLTLGISKAALRDLCNLVGVSAKMNTTVKSVMGEDFTRTLLNLLKDAISKKSELDLTMVLGRDKIVRRFMTKSQSLISNSAFFDIAEELIEKHNFDVDSFDVASDGQVNISTLTPKSEFGLDGFKDEIFTSGLSLTNSLQGIEVDPYINRLVCTNGIITKEFNEAFKIQVLNPHTMLKFHESMKRLERNNFKPMQFTNKLTDAMKTPASVSEMLIGMDLIRSSSNIDESQIHEFIRYDKTTRDYQKLGVDIHKLNFNQQRNAKTNLTVWDVINGVTDFASHDYGYKFRTGAQSNLQINAGKMLTRSSYDVSNLVLNQPY
jgi:hypothetical protein